MTRRRWALVGGLAAASLAAGCASSDDGGTSSPTDATASSDRTALTVIELTDAQPGDVIALRAADGESSVVEWIDRRAGTIRSVDVSDDELSIDDVVTLASIEVATDGEQRGLLGHTVIDGVRYAAWTEPGTDHLVVGALGESGNGGNGANSSSPATVDRIVWDAGGTAGDAVGGHLGATADGQLVLGIGQLTDWAKAHGSGAMLLLDPAGTPDQTPTVLSDGYINPFAFAVIDDQLWVADNAVGDDTERIGAIDLRAPSVERDDLDATGSDPRAPSALVGLPDGTLVVCGYLDGRLRRWSVDPPRYGDSFGPCLTGSTVLADGTVVTATADGLVAIAP